MTVVRLDDAPAADASLRDGDVDAVVLGDVDEGTATLRVLRDPPDLLDQLVQGAAIGLRLDTALDEADVPQETIDELNDRHPVETSRIERPDPDRDSKAAVAFAIVLLMYGQLFGYGV